ncbi:hypothetical protein CMK11_13090 [Candidatus Poribacteria bacterium]|jgi:predicted nucleic acid-binding protein|nr:hypothetical protein [Candidatus Poribacteria bacterium]
MSMRNEVVLDASVAVAFATGDEPDSPAAEALVERLVSSGCAILAPPLFESEADGALRQRAYRGAFAPQEAALARSALDGLPVVILHRAAVRRRAREIAETLNQRLVYDSTYAALAELRGCELWTGDRAFHRAARRQFGFVRYIQEVGKP